VQPTTPPEPDHIRLWITEELLAHLNPTEAEVEALAAPVLEIIKAGAAEETVKELARLLVTAATDDPLARNFNPPATFPHTYLGDSLWAVRGIGMAVQVRANSFEHPTDVVTFGYSEIKALSEFYDKCFGE